MTNILAIVKKRRKPTQKTKPKPTGLSSPVRPGHMSVHMNQYNSGTQYSTEQFW